jgi:hypothetical protein
VREHQHEPLGLAGLVAPYGVGKAIAYLSEVHSVLSLTDQNTPAPEAKRGLVLRPDHADGSPLASTRKCQLIVRAQDILQLGNCSRRVWIRR